MKHTPEQDFALYAKRGDLAALGRVFDRFAPELFAIARKLSPATPSEDADDLVQGTFVTAIEKAGDFDPERSIGAWLVGILARHAQNSKARVSRRGTMPSLEGDLGGESEILGKGVCPATEVERTDWVAAIRTAVAGAGAPYQPVLEAVLLQGNSPAEAAITLNLAPGTVRQKLRRGLILLRENLGAKPLRSLLAAGAALGFSNRASAMREQVLQVGAQARGGAAMGTSSSVSATVASQPVGLGFKLALGLPILIGGALLAANRSGASEADGSLGLSLMPSDGVQARERPSLDRNAPSTGREPVVVALGQDAGQDALVQDVATGLVMISNTSDNHEGAEVWLRRPDGTRKLVDVTGPDGRFRFEFDREQYRVSDADQANASASHIPLYGDGLPLVEIHAEGYERFAVAQGITRRARDLENENIRVTAAGADFGIISLMPAHHISGRVVDAQGQGAKSELFLLDHRFADLVHETAIGETDEFGYFDLTEVGRFFYRSPRSLQLVFVGPKGTGFAEVAKDLPKDLAAGEMPPATEDIQVTLHQMELRIQVVDEFGVPLAGALVEAKALASSWGTFKPANVPDVGRTLWLDTLPESFAEVFRKKSDEWGWVTFDRLPHLTDSSWPTMNGFPLNQWTIHCTLDGFEPVTSSPVHLIDPAIGPTISAFEIFTTPTLVMAKSEAVTVTGLVLDPDGQPFAGARIKSRDSEHVAFTDSEGAWTWTIENPSALPIDLDCDAEGFAYKAIRITEQSAQWGESYSHDVQLEAPVGLSIHLVDHAGNDVNGVSISVSRDSAHGQDAMNAGTGSSQMGGRFTWSDLPAGLWDVRIGNHGWDIGKEIEPISTTVLLDKLPIERKFAVTLVEPAAVE